MMFLVLAAAAAALALHFRKRMHAMESTIIDLNDRMGVLERWRTAAGSPIVAPAAPKPPAQVTPARTAVPLAPAPPPARPADRQPPPPPVRPQATPASTPVLTPASTPAALSTPPVLRSRSDARDALETRIGSRWLLYIGVAAIIIGVSYFEKLAIDNHWVSETARVIQGAILGLVLVAAGLRFVRAGYRLYGQVLSGCGIAILYVSTYAAFNFYRLVGQPVAFILMSGVTILGAWLADRQRSQSLALVAVGGGFLTPFLLRSTTDAEVALFGYEAILIAGTMLLSRRRDWPTLNVVSYAFTVLTVGAWAARFYAPSKYLPTELFLTLFCAMFLFILRECGHSRHPSAAAERAILWTAPFGYYLASLAVLSGHSSALLIYLVILSLVGIIVCARAGSPQRLAFWLAVAAPLLLWSDAHGGSTWLAAGLAAWAGVYILNLAGLLEATLGEGRRFAGADIVLLHANGLAAYAGAYLLIEPVRAAANAPLAAGLALTQGILGYVTLGRRREEALHFVALAFTLLTIAVALQFDGAWITSAWAAEGAAVIWLGLRERREWLRLGGLLLFAVAIIRLIALQFSDPPVGQILLLNGRAICGTFVIALTYLLTLAHQRPGSSPARSTETGIGLVTAKLLLLALAASEIVAYWMLHPPPPFEPGSQVVAACLIVGTVTMWLGLKRRQEWVRGVGGAVIALSLFSLLSMQLEAVPREYVTVLNGRAAAGVFAVLILYGLAALHRRLGAHVTGLPVNLAVLTTGASLLSLSLLTSEIDAFWAARGAADAWSIPREGLQVIAWAGVGGFLIWQGLSNRRTWIRAAGGALLAIAILRLLRLQFADVSPGYIVVTNARFIASVIVVALLYGLARLYQGAGEALEARYGPHTILWLMANALTLTLLTGEITAYWQVRDILHVSALASANSEFAREMMLSVTWALYATLLIVVGLKKKYAPIRYFAMTVFGITIVKVFAIDLAELDRIYRVLSIVGLGVALLLTSYLYQRSRVTHAETSG
jgi:uncharacterized membrane protein